jgi:hypothetical protein
VQGSLRRAEFLWKYLELNNIEHPKCIILTLGLDLMNLNPKTAEASENRSFLVEKGFPEGNIRVVRKGVERIGNFFHIRKNLSEILKEYNPENLYLPIEPNFEENYLFLLNTINKDILNEKKFVPIEMPKVFSPQEYVIQHCIKHDTRNVRQTFLEFIKINFMNYKKRDFKLRIRIKC